MHIFPYSRRAGTTAARMPGQLSRAVKTERARQMAQLDERMSIAYRERMVGSVQPVLFETVLADGTTEGQTPQAISVFVKGAQPGEVHDIRLMGLHQSGMKGEMIG